MGCGSSLFRNAPQERKVVPVGFAQFITFYDNNCRNGKEEPERDFIAVDVSRSRAFVAFWQDSPVNKLVFDGL